MSTYSIDVPVILSLFVYIQLPCNDIYILQCLQYLSTLAVVSNVDVNCNERWCTECEISWGGVDDLKTSEEKNRNISWVAMWRFLRSCTVNYDTIWYSKWQVTIEKKNRENVFDVHHLRSQQMEDEVKRYDQTFNKQIITTTN